MNCGLIDYYAVIVEQFIMGQQLGRYDNNKRKKILPLYPIEIYKCIMYQCKFKEYVNLSSTCSKFRQKFWSDINFVITFTEFKLNHNEIMFNETCTTKYWYEYAYFQLLNLAGKLALCIENEIKKETKSMLTRIRYIDGTYEIGAVRQFVNDNYSSFIARKKYTVRGIAILNIANNIISKKYGWILSLRSVNQIEFPLDIKQIYKSHNTKFSFGTF